MASWFSNSGANNKSGNGNAQAQPVVKPWQPQFAAPTQPNMAPVQQQPPMYIPGMNQVWAPPQKAQVALPGKAVQEQVSRTSMLSTAAPSPMAPTIQSQQMAQQQLRTSGTSAQPPRAPKYDEWPADALFPTNFFDPAWRPAQIGAPVQPVAQWSNTGYNTNPAVFAPPARPSTSTMATSQTNKSPAPTFVQVPPVSAAPPAPTKRKSCAGPFAAAGDTDAIFPMGFFDESRRSLTWALTLVDYYTAPRYTPQPGAWLKAAKEYIRPMSMRAPKDPKPAKKADNKKAKQQKKPPKQAASGKAPQQVQNAAAKPVASSAPQLKPQAASNKPLQQSGKAAQPVVKRPCPGPFAAAGDNEGALPGGFFDETRRTMAWQSLSSSASAFTPRPYAPQPGAWLKAAKEYVRPMSMRAPKDPKPAKKTEQQRKTVPVPAKKAPAAKPPQKAEKPKASSEDMMAQWLAGFGSPAPKAQPQQQPPQKQVQPQQAQKQMQPQQAQKQMQPQQKAVGPVKKMPCPGPFAAAGDTNDHLAHGFFDETRRSNMWAHVMASVYVQSTNTKPYTPQPGAWLKAAKEYIRPMSMRAPKDPKPAKKAAKKTEAKKPQQNAGKQQEAKKPSTSTWAPVAKQPAAPAAPAPAAARAFGPMTKAEAMANGWKPSFGPLTKKESMEIGWKPSPSPEPSAAVSLAQTIFSGFQWATGAKATPAPQAPATKPLPAAAKAPQQNVVAQPQQAQAKPVQQQQAQAKPVQQQTQAKPVQQQAQAKPVQQQAQAKPVQQQAQAQAKPVQQQAQAKPVQQQAQAKPAQAQQAVAIKQMAAVPAGVKQPLSGSQQSLNKSGSLSSRTLGSKVPGPFANDPNESIPAAFFNERRRARCWRDDCVPKVRKTWKPVKYQPQPGAWLRAFQPVVRPKHSLAPKEPKVRKEKPLNAEQKRLAEKARIQKLVVARLSKKCAPLNSYVHLMAEWVLLGLAPLDRTNTAVMKLLINGMVRFQGPHLPAGRCRCTLCTAPRVVPKCPGPLVATGDTNASLPLGFFDERRRTMHWEGYVADPYVPVKYVPQRNAWLWAARAYVRPRHLRAPKEPKVRKETPVKVIYQAPAGVTLPIGPRSRRASGNKRSSKGVEVPQYTNHVVYTPSPRTSSSRMSNGEIAAKAMREITKRAEHRRSHSFSATRRGETRRNRALMQPTRGV